MSVTIKLSNGTQRAVDVPDLGISVAGFKELAAAVIDIPADEQRVVLRGRVLKDTDVLSAMGMEYGQAVHIVRGQKSAKKETPAAPTTSQSTTNAQGTQSNPTPQRESEVTNPYMALSGNPPAAEGTASSIFPNAAPGWPMSSDGMAQMWRNPAFLQLVQETMGNSQIMQQLMQQSPTDRFGGNDVLMQQLLNNPALLQHTMQLMSNPAFMQQMLQATGGAPPGQNLPFFGQPSTQPMNPLPATGFSQPQGDPRAIYQSQLQQLREMGFPNEEANLAALQQAQGNLDFAIERLLNA
ncbi:ubiquitin-like protein [Trypanosoma grayi]|uniref:ubiquitin-like protein n=1 Tax=Trypanosoma grayi TaxID=71804 RepID=UPI0004F46B7C|nr:ubiquitin-like protein [Trypanosoma grayi]KEG10166.1 ubiquitin-like protein [Trypanosoma grayi]